MIIESKNNFEIIKYDSINEFYDYICETPLNKAFKNAKLSSTIDDEKFTGTKSFDEAVNLMKNGWEDMSKKLTQKLNVICKDTTIVTKKKSVYDVVGYQANVPRYLQGIPTNMVRTINTPAKQKAITIIKSIDYSANIPSSIIIEESIKALAIVKKIEAQGTRVNLDICVGSLSLNKKENNNFLLKIRVKNANERLNISKLAFVLVHPSMLRRLVFRWIEVYPKISKYFISNYGAPAKKEQLLNMLGKNEYLIPALMLTTRIEEVKGFEDLLK